MRLARLVMASGQYDPKVRSDKLVDLRSEFDERDGYELEIVYPVVRVTHGEHSAVYPMSAVKYGVPKPKGKAK